MNRDRELEVFVNGERGCATEGKGAREADGSEANEKGPAIGKGNHEAFSCKGFEWRGQIPAMDRHAVSTSLTVVGASQRAGDDLLQASTPDWPNRIHFPARVSL